MQERREYPKQRVKDKRHFQPIVISSPALDNRKLVVVTETKCGWFLGERAKVRDTKATVTRELLLSGNH